MANTNLANAKTAKNDEFYTQYADIQKEINAYLDYNPDVFRDKTVLLPCDFDYVLGGCKDTSLINVQLLDNPIMRKKYEQQTAKA